MGQDKLPAFVQELNIIRYGLSFKAEQAWLFSTSYMTNYLSEHMPVHGKASDEAIPESDDTSVRNRSFEVPALFAAARLDWLLRKTRPSLSGLLSEHDVIMLLDCFQDDIFLPDQFQSIASDLCDHLGIELDDYETSNVASLVDKLRRLNSVQRVALVDALEQAWHRGMKQENKSLKEFFATLDIDLA